MTKTKSEKELKGCQVGGAVKCKVRVRGDEWKEKEGRYRGKDDG